MQLFNVYSNIDMLINLSTQDKLKPLVVTMVDKAKAKAKIPDWRLIFLKVKVVQY
jgi:hypothetical protein